jgi:hypothetical protein
MKDLGIAGSLRRQSYNRSALRATNDKCELGKESYQACPHCADGIDPDLALRKRLLQLLALIEHPTALPEDAALRIAQELLAWTAPADSKQRCDHGAAVETHLEAVA